MFVAEIAASIFGDMPAMIVAFIFAAAYFFTLRFFESRGNPDALRKDWPITLALGAAAIVIVFFTAMKEKREVFLTQGFGFLIVSFVGIFAGAFVASRAARRKARQQ